MPGANNRLKVGGFGSGTIVKVGAVVIRALILHRLSEFAYSVNLIGIHISKQFNLIPKQFRSIRLIRSAREVRMGYLRRVSVVMKHKPYLIYSIKYAVAR